MASFHQSATSLDLFSAEFTYGGKTVLPGRKPPSGLVKKFFSRPSNPSAWGMARGASHDNLLSAVKGSKLMPDPSVRPLGRKLEARVEVLSLQPRPSIPNLTYTTSNAEKIRPNGLFSPKQGGNEMRDQATLAVKMSKIQVRGQGLRESIAALAAANDYHLQDWLEYLRCYSEGRYSLISPPDPPPLKPAFSYLPATFPSNEEERLASLRATNTEWSSPHKERARVLVGDAMAKFKSPWAAISLVDREVEIIMAECGYRRERIHRRESIAAHVLLSNEVMVVLDTQKDWRFAGNPLVVGHPGMRFFAGAPLLSHNGTVIGVFYIFGPQPRQSFTASQRRTLADYGTMVMADLTYATPVEQEGSQVVPLLQRESPMKPLSAERYPNRISGRYNHTQVESYDMIKDNLKSHCHKDKNSIVDIPLCGAMQTPPNSDDSDDGTYPRPSTGYGRNSKHLSIEIQHHPLVGHDLMTPESPVFGMFSHRDFSGSDLTSVEQLPHRCTPESWYEDEEDMPYFRPEDIMEQISSLRRDNLETPSPDRPDDGLPLADSPVIGKSLEDYYSHFKVDSVPQFSMLDSIDSDEITGLDLNVSSQDNYHNTKSLEMPNIPPDSGEPEMAEERANSMNERKSNLSISTNIAPSSDQEFPEAQFAAEYAARSLDYDCLYVAEFSPQNDEDKSEDGTKVQIITSYGLAPGTKLSISLHLQVLRESIVKLWEAEKCGANQLCHGFMTSLKSDGPSRGVVIGAFRNASTQNECRLPKVDVLTADIQHFKKAATAMRKVLFNPELQTCRTIPRPVDSPPSYPANEALEVFTPESDQHIQIIQWL